MLKINRRIVDRIPVVLPSLPEQREIVAIIDAWETGARSEATKLESLQQVKAGLLQDLLTGKVRVSA
jgi:type I restriction enzyme S subunit